SLRCAAVADSSNHTESSERDMNLSSKLFPLALAALALPAAALAATSNPSCTLPGVLVSPGGTPPSFQGQADPIPGHTIEGVYMAEPAPGADGADKLVVTMKVDTLS